MDMMTQLKLMTLGAYVALLALTLGPLLSLAWLLELRDRRQSRLRDAVLRHVTSEEVRRRIRVDVRCALFSRKGLVTLDMSGCSRKEIWEAVTRLSHRLPPRVRVAVFGALDGQFPAAFRLEPPGRRPLARPAPASAPGC